MNKLNPVIYHKLFLQAEEAKDQGLAKLASTIFEVIGASPNEESVEYTYGQLKEDVRKDLWKLATKVIFYYDLQSVDAQQLDENIEHRAHQLIEELETVLGVDGKTVSPHDKLPGQS